MRLRGAHRHILQDAVNAVTDAKFILERLQMNVRRAQLDGVLEHLVDEANDGRLVLRAVEVRVLIEILVNDF